MRKELFSPSDRLSPAELARVNDVLAPLSTQDRLALLLPLFGSEHCVFTLSNSDLMPKIAVQAYTKAGISLPVRFIFIDTLLYEQSTLDFIVRVQKCGQHEGYVVDIVTPDVTIDELTRRHPRWMDQTSVDYQQAKELLKVGPLNRVLKDKLMWISGPRRNQPSRADMPIFDQREDGLFVLHPIVDWTDKAVEAFGEEHGVLKDLLHYDFFRKNDKMECGIHLSGGLAR